MVTASLADDVDGLRSQRTRRSTTRWGVEAEEVERVLLSKVVGAE